MKWLLVLSAMLASFLSEDREVISPAKLGREGTRELRTMQPNLAVKEAKDRSPILVRIADVRQEDGEWIYDLRFIGSRPGRHDLRDYLTRSDGVELGEMGPILVNIEGSLPADHDGSLNTLETPGRGFYLPYRRLLQLSLVGWFALTCYFAYRVWSRTRPVAKSIVEESPPIDPLPALVEQALKSELDGAGQARLEMLLLARCQTSLTLGELSPQEALRRMRSHPQAAELVKSLENWLHARPGTHEVNLPAVLAPYRSAT